MYTRTLFNALVLENLLICLNTNVDFKGIHKKERALYLLLHSKTVTTWPPTPKPTSGYMRTLSGWVGVGLVTQHKLYPPIPPSTPALPTPVDGGVGGPLSPTQCRYCARNMQNLLETM
ncbi:hypothetical protein OTU49_013738 [Cherax quadricarinatus]|uniref:Uncharacterized protein n=1 Tax=Cherax quadricarinatus TaxID=27406 RepID=A0AAW0VRX6_CHEQU